MSNFSEFVIFSDCCESHARMFGAVDGPSGAWGGTVQKRLRNEFPLFLERLQCFLTASHRQNFDTPAADLIKFFFKKRPFYLKYLKKKVPAPKLYADNV